MTITLVDTSVINLIMDRIADEMNEEMIDGVTDASQAGLVRTGRLQADPTIGKLNILIQQGGKDWPDKLAQPGDFGIRSPFTYELGGVAWWRRRFMIKYELFFLGETNRNNARTVANVVFSRFQRKLKDLPFVGLKDTFGETAVALQTVRQWMKEEGGSGTFIWRGEHWVEFLTEQSS